MKEAGIRKPSAGSREASLEATLPASRRHPEGAPRCQAVRWRDGQPHQCRKKARDGFPVCGSHGAGYRKRELEGRTQNPAFAKLATGTRATPATMEQLWRDRPELRGLYEDQLNADDLLDMRPVLAQAKALAAWIMKNLDPGAPEGQSGVPIVFKAMQSLSQLMRAARDLASIERDLGPVTHADLRRLTHGVAETIKRFVPAERQSEALTFLRIYVGPGGGKSADSADGDTR